MCHKILYHTQIHRELKVFLIPHKQLHLSSSRLLGANPANRAKTIGVIMTSCTSRAKDLSFHVLAEFGSARRNQPVPLKQDLLFLLG